MLKTLLATLLACSSIGAVGAEGDRYNFRVEPIGLLFQTFTMDVDHKISDRWTLGLEVMHSDIRISAHDAGTVNDIYTESIGTGIFANYWFKGKVYEDGLYLSPAIKYAHHKHTMRDAIYENRHGSADIVSASLMLRRGWFWNTFNMSLGVGFSQPLGNSKVYIDDPNSGRRTETKRVSSNLGAEYHIGWTF